MLTQKANIFDVRCLHCDVCLSKKEMSKHNCLKIKKIAKKIKDVPIEEIIKERKEYLSGLEDGFYTSVDSVDDVFLKKFNKWYQLSSSHILLDEFLWGEAEGLCGDAEIFVEYLDLREELFVNYDLKFFLKEKSFRDFIPKEGWSHAMKDVWKYMLDTVEEQYIEWEFPQRQIISLNNKIVYEGDVN